MVKNVELVLALDENNGDLLGCIQVEVKGNREGGNDGLPNLNEGEKKGEFTCLAVRSNTKNTVTHAKTQAVKVHTAPSQNSSARGRGIGAALVRVAEAHCRSKGCTRMQLGIMCPVVGEEPEYKKWLQKYYLGLGYEHLSTLELAFEKDAQGRVVVDQLHDMYEPLHQPVQCKAILFDKLL